MGLSLVSWNIHRGRGADGRVDAERVLSVLRSEVLSRPADILVLQEADAEARPHDAVLDRAALEAATGLASVQDDPETRSAAGSLGFLGVAVLVHPDLGPWRVRVLDLPGHCPRGAVVVDTAAVRIVAVHLSLGQAARFVQLRVVGQFLARHPDRPTILAGDLNEWRPWGGVALSRRVLGRRFLGPARPSFPVARPLFPLDRVLAAEPARVTALDVLDGPGIRAASDHRPVRAVVAGLAP